jgi:hypothetical protein
MLLATMHIAFEMKNLLPRPKSQLAIDDRHGQRRPEQSCLKVGMAIAIVPCLFVAIVAAGRYQLIQNVWHVLLQARLELYRTDRSGAANIGIR